MKQRNRGGRTSKNQFTDSKDQEVVICVAQISASLFPNIHEVQPNHWVIPQLPLSCLQQSSIFLASSTRTQATLKIQGHSGWRRDRCVCVLSLSPIALGRSWPYPSPPWGRKAGASPVSTGGDGVWLGHSSSWPERQSVNYMDKQICLPLSISSSHSPTLYPFPRAFLKLS